MILTVNQIKYKCGYKYQIAEDYQIKTDLYGYSITEQFIKLNKFGLLTVKSGYAYDGPSGPTVDTLNFMRGALVHDVLYQLMREERILGAHREYADRLLRRICLEDGMSRIRAWLVYSAVRFGAGFAANPKNKKKIIIAPKVPRKIIID